MDKYKISVVIPVKNGATTLRRCLDSLREQSIGNVLEIIVLDSMSTDASSEIAATYGAKIIAVPDGTFDHGLTRNVGVQFANSDLIYLTVQDAWLSGNDMLEKMASHFKDPSVMAVVGHQAVPHEKDKNPFLWYRPISPSSVTERIINDKEGFTNLSQKEQQALVAWDDVVAMYRKGALVEQPFEKTAFAEDWIWSYRALLKGWKLLHDSSVVVYHYHHHSFDYAFRTTYTINYHFYKYFEYKPELPPLVLPIIRAIYHLVKNEKLSLKEKLFWIVHNVGSRISMYFSTIIFLIRFNTGGEKGIEKGFKKYCKSIPQGKQKK